MALVVEDGTGVASADSYVSTADADTYHGSRGNAAWALLDQTTKEINLRVATDFMLATFRGAWKGYRSTSTQRLDWPRADVQRDRDDAFAYLALIPFNIVPDEVKQACAEYALVNSTTPLLTSLSRGKKSVKIGPIEIEYDGNSAMQTAFIMASRRLAPLLKSGGNSNVVGLVRR
jgi:DnaT-like ssDNA binding protein